MELPNLDKFGDLSQRKKKEEYKMIMNKIKSSRKMKMEGADEVMKSLFETMKELTQLATFNLSLKK
jgi:hypothetical protein